MLIITGESNTSVILIHLIFSFLSETTDQSATQFRNYESGTTLRVTIKLDPQWQLLKCQSGKKYQKQG